MKWNCVSWGTLLLLAVWGLSADAALLRAQVEGGVTAEDLVQEEVYSPYANRAYPDQVFFGDTHFHTEVSFDAGLVGTTLDIHDAFRVARGETVISNTGQPVQLIRPLDFLAVTEHAEFNGLATALRKSDPVLLSDPWGSQIYKMFNAGPEGRMAAFQDIIYWGTVRLESPFSTSKVGEASQVSLLCSALGQSTGKVRHSDKRPRDPSVRMPC